MTNLRYVCCLAIALCVGCDRWSDDSGVRASDAVLSEAKLRGITARGNNAQLASMMSGEGCEAARNGLEEMAEATGGAMRYEGGAELIVERSVWSQVPVNLRGDLATAVAIAGTCGSKTLPRDVVLTIRDPDGVVLQRGRPATFQQEATTADVGSDARAR